MFTGIIESIGVVRRIEPYGGGLRLGVRVSFKPVMGESIAINGICVTVTGLFKEGFYAFLSSETINRTTASLFREGNNLHVERAVSADGRFGGHIVQGHVDCVGEVIGRQAQGESLFYKIRVPHEFSKFLYEKGSIAVDGVSLTINGVEDDSFSVVIVPFTRKMTMFDYYRVGEKVNIEVDVIAKIVTLTAERILGEKKRSRRGRVTEELLISKGLLK